MKNFIMSITGKILTILLICLSCSVSVKGYEIGDEVGALNSSWHVQITSLNPPECKLLWNSMLGYEKIPAYVRIRRENGIGDDGYAVTTIGRGAFEKAVGDFIRTINIPNTVRTIEGGAFKDLYIYELIIPASVTNFSPIALDNAKGFFNILDRSGKLPAPEDVDQYKQAYVVTTVNNMANLSRCQLYDLTPSYKDVSFLGLSIWEYCYPYPFKKYINNKAYIEAGDIFSFNITSIPSIPHVEIIEGEDIVELTTILQKASEQEFHYSNQQYNDEEILKYDAGRMHVSLKGLKSGKGKLKIYNEIGDTIDFTFYVINKYPTSITIPKELEVPINTKTEIAVATTPEDATCVFEWEKNGDSDVKSGCTIDEHNVFIGATPGKVTIRARFPNQSVQNSFILSNNCEVYIYDKTQLSIDELKDEKSDTIKIKKNNRILLHPTYLGGKSSIPVSFEINDTSVATVDNEGYLCGTTGGTTQVTIRSTENPNVFKTFVLKAIAYPEKIEIDIPDQLITVGDTIHIQYRVLPENAIYNYIWWSCFNDLFKKLDGNGNFLAVGAGKTEIDMTVYYPTGEICETIPLYIYNPIDSISLNKTKVAVEKGKKEEINIRTFPSWATKYTINNVESENPEIIGIEEKDNGSYYYVANELGKSKIKVDITDHKNNNFTETINVYCYSLDWEYDEQYTNMATGDSIQASVNISPSIILEDFAFSYKCGKAGVKVERETGMVKTSQAGTYEIELTGSTPPNPYVQISSSIKINVFDPEIKFDNKDYSVYCNEFVKINKECFPYELIDGEWSVSNDEVATIDQEGNIRGQAPGVCDIIYRGKTKGGILVENSCRIEVKEVLISDLELSKNSIILEIENTYQLNTAISPESATNKTITWDSSNPDIATVDESGLITAVKPGTAIITATTSNGLTATCEVTVLPVLVKNIILNPNEIQGQVGESFTIEATVLPENASEPKIKWESTNPEVATVNQVGYVEIFKEGSCRIIAYATDSSDVSAECIITSNSGIESIFADRTDHISVYTSGGLLIKKNCSSDDLKNLVPGIYIITTETKTIKVILR